MTTLVTAWLAELRQGRNDDARDVWERRTNLVLLLLAAAMLPLLIVPEVTELNSAARRSVTAAEWAIWAVFAVDLAVRLQLAERRWEFLRQNWLDVLIVVLPFLRPLRLLRAVAFLARAWEQLDRRGIHGTITLTTAVLFGATVAIFAAENAAGSEVHSWDSALWWTLHTMATGDGVMIAETTLGKVIGAIVTLLGFALLGMVTATIAAWFVEQDQDKEQEEILAQLAEVREQLRLLQESINRPQRDGD